MVGVDDNACNFQTKVAILVELDSALAVMYLPKSSRELQRDTSTGHTGRDISLAVHTDGPNCVQTLSLV